MTGTQLFILGLLSSVISAALGYLLHRRSRKVDAVSEQSGAVSNQRAGTQQIIDGFNLLLERAQETIEDDREVIKLLEGRIVTFTANLEACQAENARLRKKYGDNGDTPQPPTKGT